MRRETGSTDSREHRVKTPTYVRFLFSKTRLNWAKQIGYAGVGIAYPRWGRGGDSKGACGGPPGATN